MVGFSTYPAYLAVDRTWVSLATLQESEASVGSEVSVIWGEENGGSAKPGVERHFQKEIRATVAPWPYSKAARESYRLKR